MPATLVGGDGIGRGLSAAMSDRVGMTPGITEMALPIAGGDVGDRSAASAGEVNSGDKAGITTAV
jgi:hypothetical protein